MEAEPVAFGRIQGFRIDSTGLQNCDLCVNLAACTYSQLLLSFEEAKMNELYTWVSQQHHGLRTFKTLQQKLEGLSAVEPEQRGLYRLLSNIVGGYIEAFDEEPLPVEVADRVHRRLLELLASLDVQTNSDRRLADINRVASFDLLH